MLGKNLSPLSARVRLSHNAEKASRRRRTWLQKTRKKSREKMCARERTTSDIHRRGRLSQAQGASARRVGGQHATRDEPDAAASSFCSCCSGVELSLARMRTRTYMQCITGKESIYVHEEFYRKITLGRLKN